VTFSNFEAGTTKQNTLCFHETALHDVLTD